MSSPFYRVDFRTRTNADWRESFDFGEVLTGAALTMQVRTAAGALALELTTGNGRLSIDGTGKLVSIIVPRSVMDDLAPVASGAAPYRHDIVVVKDGVTRVWWVGDLTHADGVTELA